MDKFSSLTSLAMRQVETVEGEDHWKVRLIDEEFMKRMWKAQ